MKPRHFLLGGRYALLVCVSLIILFPIIYCLVISLDTDNHVATYPPQFLPYPVDVRNYFDALKIAPLGRFLINSFIMSAIIVAGQLITSLCAAFGLVYSRFRGRRFIFYILLSTMMIPGEITVIPNYLTVKSLGWLNTFEGLTIPFLANAFGVFLLRQNMMQLPKELWDSARIDGAGKLRFLYHVVVPLLRPAIATLCVYVFLQSWNSYLWPLLVTNSTQMQTVQIGLAMLQNQDSLQYNLTMAGVITISIPTILLLIFGQKQLVRGLTAGAVKG